MRTILYLQNAYLLIVHILFAGYSSMSPHASYISGAEYGTNGVGYTGYPGPTGYSCGYPTAGYPGAGGPAGYGPGACYTMAPPQQDKTPTHNKDQR